MPVSAWNGVMEEEAKQKVSYRPDINKKIAAHPELPVLLNPIRIPQYCCVFWAHRTKKTRILVSFQLLFGCRYAAIRPGYRSRFSRFDGLLHHE